MSAKDNTFCVCIMNSFSQNNNISNCKVYTRLLYFNIIMLLVNRFISNRNHTFIEMKMFLFLSISSNTVHQPEKGLIYVMEISVYIDILSVEYEWCYISEEIRLLALHIRWKMFGEQVICRLAGIFPFWSSTIRSISNRRIYNIY